MPCATVTVSDQTRNESALVVTQITPLDTSAGQYLVEVEYRNKTVSGEGESLNKPIRVTLDGGEVAREMVALNPGLTSSITIEGGAEPGEHTICAEVV